MAVAFGALLARPPPSLRPRVHHAHQGPHATAALVPSSKRARVVLVAAASDDPTPSPTTTPGVAAAQRAALEADALLAELPDLLLPSTRHQPTPLPRERLRALRAESEELAKRRDLARFQVGAKGLTPSVVAAAAAALAGAPGGLLRIKLGEGCGLERRSAAAALERLLDAVCVKQVGFCITVYRERGLPRPDNLPEGAGVAGGGKEAAATPARPAAKAKEDKRKRGRKDKAASRDRSTSPPPPPPPKPPAFTVV